MRVGVFIPFCILVLFFPVFATEADSDNTAVKSESTSGTAPSENPEKIKVNDGADVKKTDSNESDNIDNEQDYNLKLRNLEEKINSLKDKIFRSKQRLSILQETVLSGSIAGARLTIVHKNEVGKAFKLVSVIYYLDEAPVFKKLEESPELEKDEIVIYDGSVVPGPHHISVFLVYQGKGFGFFSYMKGYSFKMKTGHSVNIEEGNLMEITVVSKDRGSSTKIDNRLFVSFDVSRKMFEDTVKADQEKTDQGQ